MTSPCCSTTLASRCTAPCSPLAPATSRPCSAPSCPKTTSSRSDLTLVPLLHAQRQRRQGQISPLFRSFMPKDNVVKVRSHPCSAPSCPKTTSSRSDLAHVPLLHAQRQRRQGQISPMFRSFRPKDNVVKVRSHPCSAPSCPKTTSSRSDLIHGPFVHAQGQIFYFFQWFSCTLSVRLQSLSATLTMHSIQSM